MVSAADASRAPLSLTSKTRSPHYSTGSTCTVVVKKNGGHCPTARRSHRGEVQRSPPGRRHRILRCLLFLLRDQGWKQLSPSSSRHAACLDDAATVPFSGRAFIIWDLLVVPPAAPKRVDDETTSTLLPPPSIVRMPRKWGYEGASWWYSREPSNHTRKQQQMRYPPPLPTTTNDDVAALTAKIRATTITIRPVLQPTRLRSRPHG